MRPHRFGQRAKSQDTRGGEIVQPRPGGNRQIKGAARRSVRPKSREETPKEGSEASDRVTNFASPF